MLDSILPAIVRVRLQSSCLRRPITTYAERLASEDFSPSTVRRRVVELLGFGESAAAIGLTDVAELHAHVGAYVEERLERRNRPCPSTERRNRFVYDVRLPIDQMLALALPDCRRRPKSHEPRLGGQGVHFFEFLRQERGLRPATISLYAHHLTRFEQYLGSEGIDDLAQLVPEHIDGFLLASRTRLSLSSLSSLCSSVRWLLRWLFRQQVTTHDLSFAVGAPMAYRLSTLPRSIAWNDVQRTLDAVNRETEVGKRDYAMLVVIVLYGLRAREVAALALSDIDWRKERLHIRGRKAGHSTTYPLAASAGEALLDYIRVARPETKQRRIFIRAMAPRRPVGHAIVSSRARYYLRNVGVAVRRPGSHTLRHSCAQRLVDADFSLKAIGDYLGHRTPSSTEIYTKVAIDALRQVALGDGEEVL